MAANRVKEFDGKMVLLGIVFIALPPWLSWGLIGSKFLDIRYMLAQGTESTAKVTSRDTQTRSDSRGRRKESKRSVLHFDGHWGTVPFWVIPDTVSVIYDDTKERPKSNKYRPVIIGEKSDGYFSVLDQNHGKFIWVPVTFWTVVNVFALGVGAVMLLTGLGLRAAYQEEPR
jgi:hypothetical protein